MNKTTIGIVFGGASEEHPISVKSAQEVARSIDPTRYEPVWIGITKAGHWSLCDGPTTDWEDGRTHPAVLSPDRETHGLLVLGPDGCDTVRLDVVLPMLHGRLGEDGAIQGLLELAGIPYVGCGIAGSALCMDKSLAYLVARSVGVATPGVWAVTADQGIDADRLPYPVFVKPARSGSSFGVTKVSAAGDLADAIAVARRYDDKVLVEQAVVGSEIGCAVLGAGADLIVGEPDQITLSHGFFRIHQEDAPETGSANSTITVPAAVPATVRALVQETAKTLYRALGCSGLARVDLFVTEDGGVVLNEVNTMPGLTSYSRYPRMMAAAGMSLSDLIDRLVALAIDREGMR